VCEPPPKPSPKCPIHKNTATPGRLLPCPKEATRRREEEQRNKRRWELKIDGMRP